MEFLKFLGWINYRGKADWTEIIIDVVTVALIVSVGYFIILLQS